MSAAAVLTASPAPWAAPPRLVAMSGVLRRIRRSRRARRRAEGARQDAWAPAR